MPIFFFQMGLLFPITNYNSIPFYYQIGFEIIEGGTRCILLFFHTVLLVLEKIWLQNLQNLALIIVPLRHHYRKL